MTLDEIQTEWSTDNSLDHLRITEEVLRTPKLHQKWYGILIKETIYLEKLKLDLQTLEKNLMFYYTKRLPDPSVVGKKGPPDLLLVTQGERDSVVSTEPSVVQLKMEYAMQKAKCEFLEDVIKEIKDRRWNIKNLIDWKKFEAGV